MKQLIVGMMAMVCALGTAWADSEFKEAREERVDMYVDGTRWLGTVITPFDAAHREETYKVFTHLYAMDGKLPITKGPGGKYSHHRGLFIGWKDTLFNGKDIDTWHLQDGYQRHVAWLDQQSGKGSASQSQQIEWCEEDGTPFVKEIRTISAHAGKKGMRVIDFTSELHALVDKIELKGDLQHAGMQIRMANEVAHHQDTTEYLLPRGSKENENDEVVGAWWMLCSPEVLDTRYWVLHMTPLDHPTGVPIYSIRQYARFGAFWESELKKGEPVTYRFRIVVSDQELKAEDCTALYKAYTGTGK
jgi:hypothetical protein